MSVEFDGLIIVYLGYMKEEKKCLNSELWHACAGPLVSLPTVGSRVVYFPQGHSEQVCTIRCGFFICSIGCSIIYWEMYAKFVIFRNC